MSLVGRRSTTSGDVPDDFSLSWRCVFDAVPHAAALVDEFGIIRHVNGRLEALSGFQRDQLNGVSLCRWVPTGETAKTTTDESATRGAIHVHSLILQRPSTVADGTTLELRRRDGTTMSVVITTSGVPLHGRPWTFVEIVDDRARDDAAQAMSHHLQRFRLAFDNNMAPMSIADADDRIVAVNQAFLQLVGYSEDELLGGDTRLFTHPDDVGITEDSLEQIKNRGIDQLRYLKRYRHKDGRVINVEISRSAARDANGEIIYFVFSGRDISDRVSREIFQELLAAVNASALRAVDEHELLDQVCAVLVEIGGYPLAWVAVESRFEDDVLDIYSFAGVKGYLYDGIVSSNEKSRRGLGPAGLAVRNGATQVNNDLGTAANYSMWRERAEEYGFASSVAVPFTLGARSAVLSLYSANLMGFDEMTVKGLEDLVHEFQLALSRLTSINETRSALVQATDAAQAQRLAERALSESEQRFRLAFEDNMAPMTFSDLNDVAIAANDAFCDMVGFSRDEMMGRDSKTYTHPEDVGIAESTHQRMVTGEILQARYVKRYLRKDGGVVVSEVSRSAARDPDGNILYFVSSERDITEERALSEQLSQRALHDPLTGLPNRTLFEDRLYHAFTRSKRNHTMGAVLLLDLDDFKGVNDTHGHSAGDQLLALIAKRFADMTRESDTLGRFGGDEFMYLAEDLHSLSEATAIAERLLQSISQRFEVTGQEIRQRASVGIVTWDGTEASCADFLQNADVAMFQAKQRGKDGFAVFTKEMRDHVTSEFELLQELRHAFDVGQLMMFYQPIVHLDSLEIAGFEALMRWQHPDRGMVPPSLFIPLAERSDLILQLGYFALEQALSAASTWQALPGHSSAPFVSVNLSARQFQDPLLAAKIVSALEENGISPDRLIIEITESVTLLDVAETSSVVKRLNATGVTFALDDFGTGYSSLSYLTELSPRIIKIDKSFVNPSLVSVRHDSLLEAIVSLGHQLDGTMLGEGIETDSQLERLRGLECEYGQGFLFSPAVPAHEVATLIASSPWRLTST